MSDERTVSAFTWINTVQRNRTKIDTMVDQIQVRQYHMFDEKVSSKRETCIVLLLRRGMYSSQILETQRNNKPVLKYAEFKKHRRIELLSAKEADAAVPADDGTAFPFNIDPADKSSDDESGDDESNEVPNVFDMSILDKALSEINLSSTFLSTALSDTEEPITVPGPAQAESSKKSGKKKSTQSEPSGDAWGGWKPL